MEDLRIRRTKNSIVKAFYALLKQENFKKITIQQIADKAMINRQTFYLHYQDKYDLLQKVIAALSRRATDILAEQVKNLKQPLFKTVQEHNDELVNDREKMYILLEQNYCTDVLRQTMRRDFLVLLKKQAKLHLTDFQAKVLAASFLELIMIVYTDKKMPSEKEIAGLYKMIKLISLGNQVSRGTKS